MIHDAEKNWPQDDADWFDILTGRPVENADPRTRREAEAIRWAVLAEHERPAVEITDADLARGREQLLFRLRREGLLSHQSTPWWRKPYLTALAASIAIAALLTPTLLQQHWQSTPPAESLLFKSFKMPVVVMAEKPEALVRQLADGLRKLGIQVEPIGQDGSWFIDVHIPDPSPFGLDVLLQQYGLTLPVDRHLLVEFL